MPLLQNIIRSSAVGLEAQTEDTRVSVTVMLQGGAPWGFRLQGGEEFDEPIRVAKINPNSKASNQGLRVGDFVEKLNGRVTSGLHHSDALDLIRQANHKLVLELRRGSLPDIKLGGVNGYPAQQQVNHSTKHVTQHAIPHTTKHSSFVHTSKQSHTKPEISYTSDVEDYRPTSAPFLKSPAINTPGLTYSDVAVSSPYEDSQSASTSDSQSSVIHVNDSRRASIASNASTLSNPSNHRKGSFAVNGSRDANNMNYSTCPSPQPRTTVWSPSGKTSVKTYKPIQFSTGFKPPGQSPSTSSQKSGIHTLQRNTSWDGQGPSVGYSSSVQNSDPYSGYQSDTVSSSQSFSQTPSKTGYKGKLSNLSSSVTAPGPYGSLPAPGVAKSVTFTNQNSAQNEDSFGANPDVDYGQSSSARWTPTLTSTTTLSMNTDKGSPSSPRGILSKVPPSPPVKPKPSPSPIQGHGRDKGFSLFMGQRGKHTDEDSPLELSNKNECSPGSGTHPLSPSKSTPPFGRSSSDSGIQPAGLSNIKRIAKPIKMVRIKDEPDSITHSRSLPSHLTSKQNLDRDISATEYHNGGGMWNSTDSQPDLWSPTQDNDLSSKWNKEQPWSSGRKPVTIETKSVKTTETSSSLASPPWRALTSQLTTASATSTTTTTTTSQSHPDTKPHSQWNGTISHFSESASGMPQTQSSTITLLQKGRDDKKDFTPPQGARTIRIQESDVPAGAVLVGSKEVMDGDETHTDTYYVLPGQRTTETRTTVKEAQKYEGIGPVDRSTGMPVGFRSGVEEKNQKDWYKKMYQTLHKTTDDSKDFRPVYINDKAAANTYKPTYVFPEDQTQPEKEEPNPYRPAYDVPSKPNRVNDDVLSSSLDRNSDRYRSLPVRGAKSKWSPAHARYREDKYKNQPRSIEDYEPGKSSIALKEQRLQQLYNPPIEKPGQFSKYYESDTEVDIRRKDRSVSPAFSDVASHDIYKAVQRGADIPQSGFRFPVPAKKERSYSTPSSHSAPSASRQYSDASLSPRQRRDEENARRRQQLEKHTEEQRAKKYEQTLRDMEARKHHDIYIQKSPIQLDRFGDLDASAQGLQRPAKKVHTEIRGKARARYSFTAQNKKELSFRKGDTVYLLNQIDKNWCEGERHGIRGIFPLNYVEVLTSLEEAQATAEEREGEARAKYNFTAQTSLELTLKKGDIVTLIRRIDQNWYEGKIGNRQGIFPSNYVEICREPDTPMMTPLPSLAPTPVPGSPGQLSPGSSIAPSIPTAPHSPRDLDSFDFDTPFDFDFPTSTTSSNSLAALSSAYNPTHGYAPQFSTHNNPSTAPSYAENRYGSLDRGIAAISSNPYDMLHSAHTTPYGMSKLTSTAAVGGNALQEQLNYVNKSSTLDRQHFARDPYSVERPKTTPPSMNGGVRESDRVQGGRYTPYAGLTKEDFYPTDLKSPKPSSDSQSTGAKQTQETRYPMYKAIYTYNPQNADELGLHEGDLVSVMEKCDDGWYVGTCLATNNFGTFPGNYVQPV